ncbi:penicillin amidase [Murinocardiopsis flavida]|uniref:Penicillin amidase n=1 Tax=Murinocardiopsis flavida TaxID=645275 RepID=A0A2P8DTJ3_9ACTN|nr:penicillin acylase family protein [Murinocardiopsis flavida]PSL00534.1 penicillin amidase [Murinocardiopsis flavida]
MRRRLKTVSAVAAGIALLLPTMAAPAAGTQARPEVIPLKGLAESARIVVDDWGVPHIYAQSKRDAFFAQGMNAARDRLFQIDLQRKRGLGLLSESFGPDFVEQDRANRLFLYRGDMAAEWASYGPGARDHAERFTSGINAYIDWLEDHPERLPPEFEKFDYLPSRWKPEDVVRIRSNSISLNVETEVARSFAACRGDVGGFDKVLALQPEHASSVPDGLDPCAVPDDVLADYHLATAGVDLSGPKPAAEPRPDPAAGGSNSWVIAPERTATGRPILAGDPHRAVTAPSLRYMAHLSAPGMDVIGAGEPSLPGVSMGHNGTSAFGITIFAADQKDLYVYEMHPDDPNRYRYGDGWEEVTTVSEKIPVAGGGTRKVDLRFTRHGPIIATDGDMAFAVRSTWSEPGTAAYFGGLELMEATDFGEFRDAVSGWGGPPLNFSYADTGGDIGWVAGAVVPDRKGYDGLMPVPGDGGYEWDGTLDGGELPSVRNPDQGFFATANEFNLPEGYPEDVGFEWPSDYRQERITDKLAADGSATIADSVALQYDELSLSAVQLKPLLDGLEGKGDTAEALELLADWDSRVSADSAGAALYETWLMRHLGPAYYREAAPSLASLVPSTLHTKTVVAAMEAPESWAGRNPEATRDRILTESLAAAYKDVAERLGPDPAQWRWGDLHKGEFRHAAYGSVESFSAGGSGDTVHASNYNPADFTQGSAASFMMALDVGDWDASRAMNAPGQSGDPRSPFYRDQVGPWQEGEFFPLLYSRSEVMRNADHVLLLRPRD